jgi:hypothetical protein
MAGSVPYPSVVATSYSKIGGPVSIMEATQQTSYPKESCGVPVDNSEAILQSFPSHGPARGYQGVVCGSNAADSQGNLIGAKQFAAVCSDAPSSEPYSVVIPCGIFIDPQSYDPVIVGSDTNVPPRFSTAGNAPGVSKCCSKDMSQLFRDNSELIADQGRQLDIRRKYNLPNKLQGLRGPVVNR